MAMVQLHMNLLKNCIWFLSATFELQTLYSLINFNGYD